MSLLRMWPRRQSTCCATAACGCAPALRPAAAACACSSLCRCLLSLPGLHPAALPRPAGPPQVEWDSSAAVRILVHLTDADLAFIRGEMHFESDEEDEEDGGSAAEELQHPFASESFAVA